MDEMRNPKAASPEEIYEAVRQEQDGSLSDNQPGAKYFVELPTELKNYWRKIVRESDKHALPCEQVKPVLDMFEKYNHPNSSLESLLEFHKYAGQKIQKTKEYLDFQTSNPEFRHFCDLYEFVQDNSHAVLSDGKLDFAKLKECVDKRNMILSEGETIRNLGTLTADIVGYPVDRNYNDLTHLMKK